MNLNDKPIWTLSICHYIVGASVIVEALGFVFCWKIVVAIVKFIYGANIDKTEYSIVRIRWYNIF